MPNGETQGAQREMSCLSGAIGRVTSILAIPYGYTVTLGAAALLSVARLGAPVVLLFEQHRNLGSAKSSLQALGADSIKIDIRRTPHLSVENCEKERNMSAKRWSFFVLCLVVVVGLGALQAAAADKPKDFPNRPITIMVGFGAGGSSDVGVRILGEALKKVIGQTVLVENKAGAGGQIMWTDFKNNAKPDGYTLALINVPQLQTTVFDPTRKPAFTMKDFQPVANHVQDPGAIFVRTESPYKTLEDLLKDAKARPKQIKASTTGIGSDDHLSVLDVERKAGVQFNTVHLVDTPTALRQVLGGHTDVNFDNVGGFLPATKSGQGRMLAVFDEKRFPDAADVPTMREKGIELISSSTRGYVYPAGTPMEIVKYMEDSIKKAMDDPDHVKRMKESGLALKFMGVDDFAKFLESQNERAKDLIGLYRK